MKTFSSGSGREIEPGEDLRDARGSGLVDILTHAWNVRWSDAKHRARTFEVEGVPIPTAAIEDLIESKRTGRLQDAADIEVLEEILRLRGT